MLGPHERVRLGARGSGWGPGEKRIGFVGAGLDISEHSESVLSRPCLSP